MTCHKTADFKKPIEYKLCSNCHKDEHNGQFLKRADGGKCESCHTVQSWKPSTYSAADHARTGFPLASPHNKVECAKCHKPEGGGAKTVYKLPYAKCMDCHQDEHKGQFAAAPWQNKCEKCHNGATWHIDQLHDRRPPEEQVSANGRAHGSGLQRLPQADAGLAGGSVPLQEPGMHDLP